VGGQSAGVLGFTTLAAGVAGRVQWRRPFDGVEKRLEKKMSAHDENRTRLLCILDCI